MSDSTELRAMRMRVTREDHPGDARSWHDRVDQVDRQFPEPRALPPLSLPERAWWALTGWVGATAAISEWATAEVHRERRVDALQSAYRKWLGYRAMNALQVARANGHVAAMAAELATCLTTQRTFLHSRWASADVMATTLILAILARCRAPAAVLRAVEEQYGTPRWSEATAHDRPATSTPQLHEVVQ